MKKKFFSYVSIRFSQSYFLNINFEFKLKRKVFMKIFGIFLVNFCRFLLLHIFGSAFSMRIRIQQDSHNAYSCRYGSTYCNIFNTASTALNLANFEFKSKYPVEALRINWALFNKETVYHLFSVYLLTLYKNTRITYLGQFHTVYKQCVGWVDFKIRVNVLACFL